MYVYNKGVVLCLQVLQVHSSARQQRILATDSQARQLSMPIDYPIEVNVLQQNDRGSTVVDQRQSFTFMYMYMFMFTFMFMFMFMYMYMYMYV